TGPPWWDRTTGTMLGGGLLLFLVVSRAALVSSLTRGLLG
ncbi:hypothetical protein CRUP_014416, partial [Coryphaenoides rupestris]